MVDGVKAIADAIRAEIEAKKKVSKEGAGDLAGNTATADPETVKGAVAPTKKEPDPAKDPEPKDKDPEPKDGDGKTQEE